MRKQYKILSSYSLGNDLEDVINKLAKDGYVMQFSFSGGQYGTVFCVMVRDVTPEQELEERTADKD